MEGRRKKENSGTDRKVRKGRWCLTGNPQAGFHSALVFVDTSKKKKK